MTPLLIPIVAAGAFYFLSRGAKKKKTTTDPTAPTPEGEGVSPPGKPKPKPGKDYAIGGIKGGGTKPPPGGSGGGGIVFEPPGTPDPDPFDPIDAVIGHWSDPVAPPLDAGNEQVDLPSKIEWAQDHIPAANEDHQVLLVDQLEDGLPNGVYYVRLAFRGQVTAPLIVEHVANKVYAWNYNGSTTYGQKETIVYKLTVNGAAGILQRISATQKKIGESMGKWMFGCENKAQCGWNGAYNSYLQSDLVWNNGLELQFRTRELAGIQQGIYQYSVEAALTFSGKP
jgi:hypothetical protein